MFTSSYEKGIDCCSEEHKHHSAMIEKSTLFSSFLTSVNILAGEFGGNLRHLKLGQWDVFVESHTQITGVLLTNPSDDHSIHDKYVQALSEINSKFLELYEQELLEWNGEISKFQTFGEIIKQHEILRSDLLTVELCNSCIGLVSKDIENNI